uniref:Uncharacterized protein n=1 Tax=Oryza punctata TaxID=4537 RepID=A0A0E0JJP0_ORYPU
MAPGTLAPKRRRKAEPSLSPSPSPVGDSSDGGYSDSYLHGAEDSFYSARSGSEDEHQDSSSRSGRWMRRRRRRRRTKRMTRRMMR